jgi:hypothetical protein
VRAAVWLKAVLLWLAILVLAMLNGLLREAVLLPRLGRVEALVASGLLLSLLILLVAVIGAPWYGTPGPNPWTIGALWLALTLSFEFGFGRLVQHRPWPELLAPYTFRGGNLWPLVLAVTAAAPRLAAWARRTDREPT